MNKKTKKVRKKHRRNVERMKAKRRELASRPKKKA
jgi:hypothetical protein